MSSKVGVVGRQSKMVANNNLTCQKKKNSPDRRLIIIGPGNLATIFFICLIRPMKACQVNHCGDEVFRHVPWPSV